MKPMNMLKLRLMYQEALQRLQDADTLSDAMALGVVGSDSPYLLKLLGLELLLKFVFESVLRKPGRGHEYEKLFGELPQPLQTRLLSLAGERIGPSALVGNHEAILQEWGQNFIALRYPWERYAALSEEQYSNIGEAWVSKGAPLAEAMFRYHPEELCGFLAALGLVAQEMASSEFNRYPSGAC
jgi:hypothetical protein